MTIAPEPKTSSVILKILKILIQNQVKADEYYIETFRGEDASISSLQGGIPTGQKGLTRPKKSLQI